MLFSVAILTKPLFFPPRILLHAYNNVLLYSYLDSDGSQRGHPTVVAARGVDPDVSNEAKAGLGFDLGGQRDGSEKAKGQDCGDGLHFAEYMPTEGWIVIEMDRNIK